MYEPNICPRIPLEICAVRWFLMKLQTLGPLNHSIMKILLNFYFDYTIIKMSTLKLPLVWSLHRAVVRFLDLVNNVKFIYSEQQNFARSL